MTAPADRLAAERNLREGVVPEELAEPLLSTVTYQIAADAFLLRLPNGLRLHYRKGLGTVYARPADVPVCDVALFFEGSVYGAIAWLNGYVPLHASAVLHDGQVFAFTGVSGEGKSTLASALAARGFALVSDDVLVLDPDACGPEDPDAPLVFSGPARMKLWADALALAQTEAGAAVRPGIDKFYAGAEAFAPPCWRPIRRLYLLDSVANRPAEVAPVAGTEAFRLIQTAYYRPHFGAAVVDQRRYFTATSRLARGLSLAHFRRSRDKAAFDAGVDAIEADIRAARA